eukprot:TRINITY_DN30664_c0_g1_i1.p1 TRINITY_DN30664_c0_g1~~TRINITY_DN30664_c0_g1_i1.p1  ORF type:complete len:520 (+),score=130.52 TRINITY_DN30664_c0_g1_i1:42-1601(+)
MSAIIDGLGIDSRAADQVLNVQLLKRLARFCKALMEAEKPKKEVIESLKGLAENVGEVETVAGAITRHIKFSKGPKLLLCWYLLDILAKKHSDSFGQVFGPQIQELSVHHMTWTDPKEEAKYVKLVETWKMLFGFSTCEEIVNKKEIVKAEHAEAERLKAERVSRGEPAEAPAEEEGQKWDSRALVLGGVKDGQLVEHVTSCKWYLMGICENPKCPRPHPPGLFGSVDSKKVLGDWKCVKCGYKNPGSKKTCWRRDCNGTKSELLVPMQDMLAENPFAKQFGYDPDNEEQAVAHFKETNWDEWRKERKRKYPIIWEEWSKKKTILKTNHAPAGHPCMQCYAPLKPGAAFCWQCGQKQFTAPPTEPQERDDLLFPSTRLSLPDAPCTVSGAVSSVLRVCRDILAAADHTALLPDFLGSIQAAAHDPTYQQLPDSRAVIILRALSHVYSKWSWHKRPGDPTPNFLVNIAAMRTILPLKDIDQETFDKIASEAHVAQQGSHVPMGPASVGPMPRNPAGTVSL